MDSSRIAPYPLSDRHAICHWLAAGTHSSPLTNLDDFLPATGSPFGVGGRWIINFWAFHPESLALKQRIYAALPPQNWQPATPPTLHQPAIGNTRWRYARAAEDQVIDFSRFNLNPALMEGWVYTRLEAPTALSVQAELLSIGPARLWVNGTLAADYAERFSYVALQTVPLQFQLQAGWNELLLYGAMIGWREARLALGLRFAEAYPLRVGIPLGAIDPQQWQQAEAGLERLQLRQFAFPQLPGKLHVQPGEDFAFKAQVSLAVNELPWASLDDIALPVGEAQFSSAEAEGGPPLGTVPLPITEEVAAILATLPGENTLALTLRPADGTPLATQHALWASHHRFSDRPYGDYEGRRQEALQHLAQMPHDVLASMAALATGAAAQVSSRAIDLACGFLRYRCDCADFYAVGLLALLYWHGDSPALLPADQQKIEESLRGFKFWIDEPGLDAMCYFTENHQILFHVAAYLSGQRYPDWTFSNSGWTGREQVARNAPRVEGWIRRRLRGSFSEWDSNAYLALDAFAMLALVEFADDEGLVKLASDLLHKIFFMLASQSFRGVHGSTHGRCYVHGLKSARFENTSTLQRIAWGMGIFNGETRAAGLLALARRYRVPELLQKIGADVERPLLTLARSRADYLPEGDMHPGAWDVRTMTYRSPQVMLSAALDYQPGEMGIQEHLWQATLSPEAVVFSNYPGNSQEHGNARPNFWAGSARLPRVGMYDRALICLYRLEAGVGLELSHVYFPLAAFDETRISGNWAFGRCGEGYVALWGDGPLQMTESGDHAGQELRSQGPGQAWLCYVGEASTDGSFQAFCAGLHSPQAQGSVLSWQNPQGQRLEFGWEGPLMVDGQAQDWENFPHYANAYTDTPLDADTMQLHYGDDSLTLHLA